MMVLKKARVTTVCKPVQVVVGVREHAMKDAWCLASSRSDMTAVGSSGPTGDTSPSRKRFGT